MLNIPKNIFLRDIERCPYVGSDPEYAGWMRMETERLEQISKARTTLRIDAHMYLAHQDRTIRTMAMFVIGCLQE